ncbi:MAG: hypothetical protein LUQ25_06930 [Methanoregulaceae archaeon]|nr:hypothetical protein [Methanoregulaceae archaeon]
MEGISTEAKIGKILILVAIILGVIGLVIMSAIGSLGVGLFFPAWLVGGFVILMIVKVIGIVIGVIAFKSAEDGDYSRAGILAIVSSVLPPIDILMLVGAIVCIISPEAKKKA